MDATATTFTKRQNAKRAAEAMIAKGTAPAIDYGIKQINHPGHGDDGRFEIVWRTKATEPAVTEGDVAAAEENWSGPANTASTTDEIATEIETASAEADADPFARIRAREEIEALGTTPEKYGYGETPASTETAAEAAAAPAERATGEAAPQPEPAADAAPERAPAPAEGEPRPEFFPVGTYVHVQLGRLRIRAGHITQRIDQANVRVHLLGAAEGVTQLVNVAQLYRVEEKPMPAEEPKPARRSRRGQPTVVPAGTRSRYSIDPDLIAAGRLPDKAPEVTSATNRRYQVHFDKLLELATADDWTAVREYAVTGNNSYSKMVARFRQDLLAVRKAQEAPATATEQGATQ